MLKKIVVARIAYPLTVKLKVCFRFKKSYIYTVTDSEYKKIFPDAPLNEEDIPDFIKKLKLPQIKHKRNPFGFLIIESLQELEPYDNVLEASVKSRPDIIVIHGILTFLSESFFASFQDVSSSHMAINFDDKNVVDIEPVFKLEKRNISKHLKTILGRIESEPDDKKILIFSVLERWRKAFYLQEESADSSIYNSESLLAYFHILEMLADEFKASLDEVVKLQKKELFNELTQLHTKHSGDKLIAESKKTVNKICELKVSAKSQILHMFACLKINSPKIEQVLSRLIDHRNAVAHGRRNIYTDEMIYPLTSFFSLPKDVDEDIDLIKILTAQTIGTYLGIDAWLLKWRVVEALEPLPWQEVNKYIASKDYSKMSLKILKSGEISAYTLLYYVKHRKINTDTLEDITKHILLKAKINHSNYQEILNIQILLSDTKNEELAKKCRLDIESLHKAKIITSNELRDAIKFWGHYGHNKQWLRGYLTSLILPKDKTLH